MTPKRLRRPTEDGEFHDPLKNYAQPRFEDDLEQALHEGFVAHLPTNPVTLIDADDTVEQAVCSMAENDVGCLLVVEGDRLVGIFTQRDLMMKIVGQYEAVKDSPISTVMTPDPVVVRDTDSPAKAINLMAVGGFRHIPVLDVDDRVVGLIGPRRATAYLKNHFPT